MISFCYLEIKSYIDLFTGIINPIYELPSPSSFPSHARFSTFTSREWRKRNRRWSGRNGSEVDERLTGDMDRLPHSLAALGSSSSFLISWSNRSSITFARHSLTSSLTRPPFSTRVAPFSPRFGPSPQARVLLSEWDGAVREGNGEGKDTAGGVGSSRLLTRSLHSSYVMWEGREEPA